MQTPLLILGAGAFAVEALEIAELAGHFHPLGFVVSDDVQASAEHAGLPVYRESSLPCDPKDVRLAAGIMTTRRRAFVERLEARAFTFTAIVHPSAVVSPRASIAAGAVV